MTNVEFSEVDLPNNARVRDAVEKVLRASRQEDGIEPLSEQFVLGLGDARLGHRHIIAQRPEGKDSNVVVGVLADDGDSAEMTIAPHARRAGIAAGLLDKADVSDVWAHGNLPAAQALAASRQLKETRKLLVMAIEGEDLSAAADVPAVEGEFLNYDESVDRFGKETVDAEWLRANNEAFDWHPEQGGWDQEHLDRAREAEWYDPRDVILLWAPDSGEDAPSSPRLMGFHWTKWHTETEEPFGEVYVVGLASDYRGRGLGGPLIAAGLRRMVEKGAQRVILYVEANNPPAVKAYEKLGFDTVEEHVVYSAE